MLLGDLTDWTAYMGSKFPGSIKKALSQACGHTGKRRRSAGVRHPEDWKNRLDYNKGTSSSATMLMILMSGLIAGPAVSL